jgi:uncharacterized protein YutE (UPF0331/DUF86 family)
MVSFEMNRWTQGLVIILGSMGATVAVLGAALAWGPHHCKLAFPMVIGCAMGSYEGLAGGMFAASAALFAGWLAWSAVQVQISAEEKRATADRVEVGRVLAVDIDSFAEALAAIWKILESLDQSETPDRAKIEGVVYGIERIADDAWLSTSRKMVTALGWERRRSYEDLFTALENLRPFCDVDDFQVYEALDAARNASSYFEDVQPDSSGYFGGLFRRSPKAWSLGYAIEVQAGVADQGD